MENFDPHWAPKLHNHPQKLLTLQWRQKWGRGKAAPQEVGFTAQIIAQKEKWQSPSDCGQKTAQRDSGARSRACLQVSIPSRAKDFQDEIKTKTYEV